MWRVACSGSTAPSSVSPYVERHPVFSVCSHSEEGHAEPARAGGSGDVQPGVVSGERVRGRGGGRGVHGHLSACPETRRFWPRGHGLRRRLVAFKRRLQSHSMFVMCLQVSASGSHSTLDPSAPACTQFSMFSHPLYLHAAATSSITPACTFPTAAETFEQDAQTRTKPRPRNL